MPESRSILLASASPRRRELLALAGFAFTPLSVNIDETPVVGESPADYTRRVSLQKAQAAQQRIKAGPLIIAADTTVVGDNMILGKPLDAADAETMLKQLRGRIHQVYTAITVLDSTSEKTRQELAITDVVMRDYSDAEIAAYIASGDPMDKAGSYAIQNEQFAPVASIVGCYANVVGLPLCHLLRLLREFNVEVANDVPSLCQAAHHIECLVYPAILGQV